MKQLILKTGDRYSRLVVVREDTPVGRNRRVVVACDCGTVKTVRVNDVRSGKTTSCGCYRNQRVAETITTHDMSHTPEYHTWWDMIARCHDVGHKSFKHYGGRGITVCDKWRISFTSFFNDVGPRPPGAKMIDREDNNAGYFPGNVRWVDDATSSQNTRRSWLWVICGTTYKTASHAAKTWGVSTSTIRQWCSGWKCYRTGKIYPPLKTCTRKLKYE